MFDNSVDLNEFKVAVETRLKDYPFTQPLSTISLDPDLEAFKSNFVSDRDLLKRAYQDASAPSTDEQFQFQSLGSKLFSSSLNLIKACFTAQTDPFSTPKDLLYLNVEMIPLEEPAVLLVADVYGKTERENCFQFDQQFIIDSKCPLTSLKDIFYCTKDFHPSKTNLNSKSNELIKVSSKRKLECSSSSSNSILNPMVQLINPTNLPKQNCKSGFIFVNGNTFCNDLRDEESIDYSAPILTWIRETGLRQEQFPNITTQSMENLRFEDMKWKLNFSNILLHHGNCVHIVVIREIRFSHLTPLKGIALRVQRKIKKRKCFVCENVPAYWITFNDKNVSTNPCFLCNDCYQEFHYDKQGNLVYDDFEVYRYYHDD